MPRPPTSPHAPERPVDATPFAPVLRAVLLTERWARFLRRDATDDATVAERALWWPPAKIAGRELAGYLQSFDEAAARASGQPISDTAVSVEAI